jgi:phosphoribosylglycinamide formyltransferase 2
MTETTESPDPEDTPAVLEPTPDEPDEPDESPDQRPERSAVMLLGSGELSRELTLAFQRLGREVMAVDRYADAPAHGVADRAAVVKMNDPEALTAIIERANPLYVVAESGVIAVDALVAAAERGLEVFPTPRAVRMVQDREGLRRLAADELGLPTAPFWFAGSADELTAIAEHAGFPLVVTPVAGVPGEGQSVLLRTEDVEAAWQRAVAAGRVTHNRVLAETVVEVDYEITLITVRTTGPTGPALHFCEPIGHREGGDGDVFAAWQPQPLSAPALDAAKSIAARIVNALGGRGVFGVELLVRGDEVYFADVRIRPHDSGLVTVRSQRLSEFELHARAILGLHVDTIMISPGAAEVTYAGTEATPAEVSAVNVNAVLADALAVAESDVRLFNRPDETGAKRRLGVALATAPDVTTARDRARRVTGVLRKLW